MPAAKAKTFLDRVFHIPPPDQANVLWLFAYAFATAAAYVIARSVADGLFLSRLGIDRLPKMYAAAAVVVILVALAYGRLAGRFPLPRLIGVTLLGLAACAVLLHDLLARHDHAWPLLAAVYLLAEVTGAVGTIQFSTLIHEVFHEREPRRFVGFITAGLTTAGILCGGLVGYLAFRIHASNLLYLYALLNLAALAPVAALQRRNAAVLPPPGRAESIPAASGPQPRQPARFVAAVALLVAVKIAVLTIIGFAWKVAAAETLTASEDQLTSFFGLYYAGSHLLTAGLQLFVTGRFLRHVGVLGALLVFPLSLLATTTTVLVASGEHLVLWALTLAKGSESLRRSLNDPALHLLYWPLPAAARRQAIAFVGGFVKPAAEALTSVFILELARDLSQRRIAYVVLVLLVLWISLVFGCRREYQRVRLARRRSGRPEGPAGTGPGQP